MNKKLSSLVAGVLLATSFSASALSVKSPLTTKNVKFENGQSYYLTTDSTYLGDVLVINSDNKLEFVSRSSFDAYTKANRAYGYWTISQEASPSGDYVYKFLNKGTGEYLSIPDSATTVLSANAENGISNFLWDLTGEPSANDSYAGAPLKSFLKDGSSIGIYNVLEVNQDYSGTEFSAPQNLSYEDIYLYKGWFRTAGIRILKKTTLTADSIDITKVKFANDAAATRTEFIAAKEMIARINAALESFGISFNNSMGGYYTWAIAVISTETPEEGKTVDATKSEIYSNQKSASEYIESILKASPYGYAAKVDGKWKGVLYTKKVTDKFTNGDGLAKGLLLVSEPDTESATQKAAIPAGPVTLQPALYGPAEFNSTSNPVSDGIGATLIGGALLDNPFYVNGFLNEFWDKENGQESNEVSIALDFTKENSPKATDNILKGKNIRIVQKNLLIDPSTGASKIAGTAPVKNDFKAVTMVQDINSGKYLYVSNEAYDDMSETHHFKLQWVSLRDLHPTDALSSTTYNNICNDDSTKALPHAGSAIFQVVYNRNNGAIYFAPRFLYQPKSDEAAADTTGSTTSYGVIDNHNHDAAKEPFDFKYYVSLAKFGNDVVLTLVEPEGNAEPYYPIYVADKNEKTYTPAVTASDVYFLRYFSELDENKADNGKYYTADGLKNLTEFEKNNYAENQWTLYKDEEEGTVTILNRATAEVFEVNGTEIEDQTLYKGVELKADDIDTYVTIQGGDTLMITPVDSIYKTDSLMGNYVYNQEFNKISSYEFTYISGLDNTKKLNVDNSGNLFIDPKGESCKFALAPFDTNYGAPAIEGKSVELKKAVYALSTLIKDTAYYVVEKDGKYAIERDLTKYAPAMFDIKVMQAADSTIYYAFVESDRSGKVAVNDETLRLFKEDLNMGYTSMFAISSEKYDVYRRLGTTIKDGIAAYDTAYVEFFKANEPNRFLYENSQNTIAGKADGRKYLGVFNKKEENKNASIFVDTAYVADNKIMPTYMLALDVTADNASISGQYLVSLSDSAKATYANCTRLAFVDAKHKGDSLIIARVGATAKDTIKIEAGKLNKATFAFELVDKVEKRAEADFYLKNADGYLWITNGVPVLTTEKANAIVFNVEKTSVVPTANEAISAEGVKVIAGEGFVVVKGAEGKKVVVANILGQTIASTVVSSSEAQIAAPAGVVVVSVEGEATVKAIVK